MNDEPRMQPIDESDAQPASKGDVRRAVDDVAQATQKGFEQSGSKSDLAAVKIALKSDLRDLANQVDGLDGRMNRLAGKVVSMNQVHQPAAGSPR